MMVSPARFERTAPRLGIWCSIRLSYEDTFSHISEIPRVQSPRLVLFLVDPTNRWLSARGVTDVQDFNCLQRHPIEDFVRIPNKGNNPNPRTFRDLSSALRPLADPALDRA